MRYSPVFSTKSMNIVYPHVPKRVIVKGCYFEAPEHSLLKAGLFGSYVSLKSEFIEDKVSIKLLRI